MVVWMRLGFSSTALASRSRVCAGEPSPYVGKEKAAALFVLPPCVRKPRRLRAWQATQMSSCASTFASMERCSTSAPLPIRLPHTTGGGNSDVAPP